MLKERAEQCVSENDEQRAYIVYNQTFALRSYIIERVPFPSA